MLKEHYGYIADSVRLDRFRTAISRVVKSGHVIADLGCGSGILGLLCLRAGADRVFAIDSTEMIEVAREMLARAELGNRSVMIAGLSQRISLPELVDVIICDHVGYFGFDYGVVQMMQDARQRFLKPGGHMIPARLNLSVCAVDSDACRVVVERWRTERIPTEFHWLRETDINGRHDVQLTRGELLGEPSALGEIDFHHDNPDFFSWSTELRMSRDGVFHGLAGWFDCELAEGVWMTNSPLSDTAINRAQTFLPIDEAVKVMSGELVKATIMARPADGMIAWSVEFPASGRRFKHSTWQGMPLTPQALVRADPTRVPKVSREGSARLTVLGYCDGTRTHREITQAVLRNHPDLLPSAEEISGFVAQVLGKDTV
jgi:SAM-dependent methyltransferase